MPKDPYTLSNTKPGAVDLYGKYRSGTPFTLRAGDSISFQDPCEYLFAFASLHTADGRGLSMGTATRSDIESINVARKLCGLDPLPVKGQVGQAVNVNPKKTNDTKKKQGAPELPVAPPVTITPVKPREAPLNPKQHIEDRVPHPTRSEGQSQERVMGGDPIDLFTGEFVLHEVDLVIPSDIMPITFARIYRSGDYELGPFGWNWDHNHNMYVRELASGDVARWNGSLHEDIFVTNGTSFEPPAGIFEKLERVPGHSQWYTITSAGGTVHRFTQMATDARRILLTSVEDRHGNKLTYSYDPQDRLAQVIDDDGRYLQFTYGNCGLLEKLIDSTGREIHYDHDPDIEHLVQVRYPVTDDFPKGTRRVYRYADPLESIDLRHSITAVEDGAGRTYVQNQYGKDPSNWDFGRVVLQLYGGYVFQISYDNVQFVPQRGEFINYEAMQVEVITPDRGLSVYTFNYRGDLLDVRRRLAADESFRVASQQFEYDAQGNRTRIVWADSSEDLFEYFPADPDPRMRGRLKKRERRAVDPVPGAPLTLSRIVWQGTYETTYQLLKTEKDESLAVTTYDYDFNLTPAATDNTGRLRKITHPTATLPDGTTQTAVTLLQVNARGQTTEVISPAGLKETLGYEAGAGAAKGQMIARTIDPTGIALAESYLYDSHGYLASRTDTTGSLYAYQFNVMGQLEQMTLPSIDGQTASTTWHFDSDGGIVRTERPRGEYQSDGVISGNAIEDRYDRNVLGHVTRAVIGANTSAPRATEMERDYRGNATAIREPDGRTIRRLYDERGLLLREIIQGHDGSLATRRTVYDLAGRPKTILEGTATELATEKPGDLAKRFEYDPWGRPSRIHNPGGTTTRYTWGARDLLEKVELVRYPGDAASATLGGSMRFEYDERGRMTKRIEKAFRTDPATAVDLTTKFFYDADGRLVKVVDPRGGVRQIQYDNAGRLSKVIDPLLNEKAVSYNTTTRTTTVEIRERDTLNVLQTHTWKFVQDARGRRTKVVEPDGAEHLVAYDDRDLPVSETVPGSVNRTRVFGLMGELLSETLDPANLAIVNQWEYDLGGRTTHYIDPAGESHRYAYDGIGRLMYLELPGGANARRTYGADGKMAAQTYSSGATTEFTYDSAGRIATFRAAGVPGVSADVPLHSFSYDELDRLTSATANGATVSRSYDSRSRLISETTHGITLEAYYDDLAGTVERRWADGRRELVSTNANGIASQVERTAAGGLGKGGGIFAEFTPYGTRHPGKIKLAGTVVGTMSYDERHRLLSVIYDNGGVTQEKAVYRYDERNRRRVELLTQAPAQIRSHSFDARDRLTKTRQNFTAPALTAGTTQANNDTDINAVDGAANAALLTYDFEFGLDDTRSLYKETGLANRSYSYLSGKRLSSAGAESFTFSTDRIRTADGTNQYEIDALGRVTRVKSGGGVTRHTLAYDPLGRVGALGDGTTTYNISYFGEQAWQETVAGSAVRQISHNPFNGGPLAFHVAGESYLPLNDGRLNMLAMIDSAGVVQERYRYHPFGAPTVYAPGGAVRASSAIGMEPWFGRMRYLDASGLYLASLRLMDPRHGTFLSVDPLLALAGPNLYGYALQNPIDNLDADGEFVWLALLAIVAVGALIGAGLNAGRQGMQMLDGTRTEFSWSEMGVSAGVGGILAPVCVVAPEVGVAMAAYGVGNGIYEVSQGNYATGTFDVVTSVAPFAFKGVREASLGPGTVIGQMRGLGESAPMSTRLARISDAEYLGAKQLYRGTTYYEAMEAAERGIDVANIVNRQETSMSSASRGAGLYFTSEPGEAGIQGSAWYWADVHGGGPNGTRGGGPTVMEATMPAHRWWMLQRKPGVLSEAEQMRFNGEGSQETFIPKEVLQKFDINKGLRIRPLTEYNQPGSKPVSGNIVAPITQDQVRIPYHRRHHDSGGGPGTERKPKQKGKK